MKESKKIADTKNDLPKGLGYKQAWMVVEGKTHNAIKRGIVKKTKRYPYQKGLELICKPDKENTNLVALTQTYQKHNYIIGDAVYRFFESYEQFLMRMEKYPKVYVYMTDRISETHGFALCKKGKLIRLFCIGDNGVMNIGEPLPEEKKMELNLPSDTSEMFNSEYTIVNEDIIVELATMQTGIDEAEYPYEDVFLGELYIDWDPMDEYPPKDYDPFEIPDEVRNSPEAEEIRKCRCEDRFDTLEKCKVLVEKWRDEKKMTHDLLNLIGEVADYIATPTKLSLRIDEMICYINSIFKYSKH